MTEAEEGKLDAGTAAEPQSQSPAEKPRLRALGAHLLAILLPFILLGAFRLAFFPYGESSNDAYYHAYMADAGPKAFLAKSFPQLTLSTWSDKFSDKELLYHAELWLMREFERAIGISLDPPFHFPAMLFLLFALAGYAYAAWRLGASPMMTLAGSTLMALLVPQFTFRALMLRPHVPAIGFMLGVCGLYGGLGTLKSKLIWGSAVSFVFAWSYSNPHFIAIPALAFGIACLKEHGKAALWIPVCSLAAVAAGLVLHPQFPNSILMWKVQCFDAFFWPIVLNNSPIGKPGEMWAPPMSYLLKAFPIFALAYLEAMTLFKLYGKGGLKAIPPSTRAVAMLAALFLGGTFMANRSIEYGCPFVALLGTLLLKDLKNAGADYPFKGRPLHGAATLAAICAALAGWAAFFFSDGGVTPFKNCSGIAAWLRCEVPKGAVIANLNWSDFPQMVYAAPDYKYVWGMDPMFSYAFDKSRTVKLDELCDSRNPPGPEGLRALTASDYAVILYPDMAKILLMAGWRCVYEGSDGWIFHLNSKPFR